MKIAQSDLSLASQHTQARQYSRTESLRAWVGNQRPDFDNNPPGNPAQPSTQVAISRAGLQAAAAAQTAPATPPHTPGAADAAPTSSVEAPGGEAVDDPKLNLLIRIIEAFTGEKVRIFQAGDMQATHAAAAKASHAAAPQTNTANPDQPQGWGVEYEFHESLHEVEHTTFSARGDILTADGKRLQFDLTLHMSREYRQTTSLSFQAGDAVRKDPLVINFDGNAAQLSERKIDFDIDADGTADRISFVTSASGFLALDKNGNGTIDDGHELFGARTGNGFAELAAYDDDANGWIDENDRIFAELRIWTQDDAGKDQLSTLAERNVGAVSLQSVATPFDLKDAANRQHGQVLSSGVYLKESGQVGTVQQLDLFV